MFKGNQIKILSLGGFGNVTQNCFAYEYNKDIIIVDCGVGFTDESYEKVELVVPDFHYLINNQEKIKGIILTHGHEDHIGGLPFLLSKIRRKIPIYAYRLTAALAEERLKEHNLFYKIIIPDGSSQLNLGSFSLKFISVTHSIPDAFHLFIRTPIAIIYHGSDFKFDWTPVMGRQTEVEKIALAGNYGTTLLLSDCLRSEKAGYTLSEQMIEDSFEREIKDCFGKFFVTTMSSNVSRWQQAINVISSHNRRLVLLGRSVEKIISIASSLGYLELVKRIIIPIEKAKQLRPEQLAFLVSGSQAQPGSALEKIALGRYKGIKVESGDKVVFSTDYIPGNEIAIHILIDKLSYLGADVSYSEILDDLHVSGHGAQSELSLLIGLVRPKWLLPIGGAFRQMKHYAILAQKMGYSAEKILLPQKNQTIEILPGGVVRLGVKIPLQPTIIL